MIKRLFYLTMGISVLLLYKTFLYLDMETRQISKYLANFIQIGFALGLLTARFLNLTDICIDIQHYPLRLEYFYCLSFAPFIDLSFYISCATFFIDMILNIYGTLDEQTLSDVIDFTVRHQTTARTNKDQSKKNMLIVVTPYII